MGGLTGTSHGTDMFMDTALNLPLDKLIVSWLDATLGK
jgi:hypothetical protein